MLPVGVIATLVPATNPCLTPAGQIVYAIKARDVLICSPHPRAKNVTNKCINIIREALVREGASADIIQGIEQPSIALTQELMKRCDMVIATGGNIVSENITLKHYMNTTWVARPLPEDMPSNEELFGDFCKPDMDVE